MPRNGYIKAVRKRERRQIARQEKEIAALNAQLHNPTGEPMTEPYINEQKERRRRRLEHNRRNKPNRGSAKKGE